MAIEITDPAVLAALNESLPVTTHVATVTLNTAQIAALHTTGIECVPAPGVGKMVLPLRVSGEIDFNSVAFAGGGGSLRFGYGTTFDIDRYTDLIGGSPMLATENKLCVGAQNSSALVRPKAELENQPFCVKLQTAASPNVGPISTFTIASGGTGHAINDELQPVAGNNNAVFVVDTVDGGGAILTGHLTNNGTGYSVANGVELGFLTGSGTGATIDITAVTATPGNGSATVSVIYATVDV